MMSPGISNHPEHKLETQRMHERVEVYIDNEKVAETTEAIKLLETDCDPVIYIPKNDLKNIDLIKDDDYNCPFKGHAELYTVKHGSHEFENSAWSYDRPYDEFQELTGHVAFYPQKVQEIRVIG